MDLLPTDDELEIADTISDLLERLLPTELIRARAEEPDAIAAEKWVACLETGLLTLGIDEDHGGLGLTLVEEVLAFQEIGRRLAPGPFLSSLLGARVAALSGNEGMYQAIVSGEMQIGLAVPRLGATFSQGVISGEVYLVDATAADYVLAIADDGATIVARDSLTDVQVADAFDPGIRLEKGRASGAEGLVWLEGRDIRSRALTLSAAILSGIAEATKDAATLHAKTREQFGRPIGVNQAVKHRCADMAVQAEAAVSQTRYAAAALTAGVPDAAFQASAAHLIAGHAAIENAQNGVQIHGGMGYTWEHDSHLYVKRARVWEQTLVRNDQDRALVLDQVIA